MIWTVNRKTYNRILETWIIECLIEFKIPEKVINFFLRAMENWKVALSVGAQTLADAIATAIIKGQKKLKQKLQVFAEIKDSD